MQMKGWQLVIGALAAGWLSAGDAWAVAQDVSISGDRWLAYGIIGALILGIILLVSITVGVAKRDNAYERSHPHHNVVPGLPVLGEEEDGKD